ncbi:MAG: FapA family protein [Lachnospiraceae bacterium]|nr:FapA family protein [Lachnospiraceae bacterium]
MGDVNGYFKLLINDKGTFLQLVPPEGEGEKPQFAEIDNYLKGKHIYYSASPVRAALESMMTTPIRLQEKVPYKVNEEMVIRISPDMMTVYGRFYPGTEGGTSITAEEIQKDISAKGLKVTIDEEAVQAFLTERHYCTDYAIAHGEYPKEGEDGYVEYLFNTDLSVKPTLKEDGTVDFFNLNTVCECKEGQELAILHPSVQGVSGMNVYGDIISARKVEEVRLDFGKNVVVNEERTVLTSKCNGHVRLEGTMVIVSDVLEIGSVDTSTGNIDYDGNLLISGNICAGFKVHASGDIEVRGVVEGAEVDAGGQIFVVRGINGMGEGHIKAGSNIVAKYIENATVTAGNYVQTECIINAHVTAKTTVTVEGKRGYISGGVVRAGTAAIAKTIGSEMGVDTAIEVGADPAMRERAGVIQKENIEITKQLQQLQPLLLSFRAKVSSGVKLPPDQMQSLKKISNTYKGLNDRLNANVEELSAIEEVFNTDKTDAYIVVNDMAYPGVHLEISGSSMVLKKPYQYCKFVREGGDVRMKPIF